MTTIRVLCVTATLLLMSGAILAQPASGTAPAAGASAPQGGPGASPGPGRMGGRWGSHYTPGWALMSPSEREQHRSHMMNMGNREDCQAYMQKHHDDMAARAKEQGRRLPDRPRGNACAHLSP